MPPVPMPNAPIFAENNQQDDCYGDNHDLWDFQHNLNPNPNLNAQRKKQKKNKTTALLGDQNE